MILIEFNEVHKLSNTITCVVGDIYCFLILIILVYNYFLTFLPFTI